jgi:CubicO group peptidase (beta-lactamase class C family)
MNQEFHKKLEDLIRKDYSNISGIVVLKNGKNLIENYYNDCNADSTIHIFSVTKSIVSILFGIAIDKGFIKNIDQKALEFFPDYTIKRGEKTIQNVTIKNMLTMTAPYKYKSAPYTKYFTSDDWVKEALDLLGGKKPIGEFRYTPLIGPDILSGILVKATGLSVLNFATKYLFSPLGISKKKNIHFKDKEEQFEFLKSKNKNSWVADPKGVNTAAWGLTLSAMDMTKIGQLYLNRGKWKGKQIVSSRWVDESLKEHSRWKELDLPFGYLWWVKIGNGYAAMGDSGNVIYINKKDKMVISIASLYKPTAKDRVELIQKHLEPMV